MSDDFDGKLERFERLREGVTPKGVNRTKALKFRQYMRNHVLEKFHKRGKEQWANADKGHYPRFLQQRPVPDQGQLQEILDGRAPEGHQRS